MRTDWFIFYDDQLLLRHDATGGRIPEGPVAPLVIDHWIEATFDDGTTGRVATVDAPEAEEAVEEADVSEPISVRDARDEEAERRLLLDSYHRLRQELIGEGLLAE